MQVGGVIGPRGDAYNVGRTPNAAEAEDYYSEQIATFRKAGADHVTAMTFSSVEEAIGLVRAAKSADMPVIVSFILPNGGQAQRRVDAGRSDLSRRCSHEQCFEVLYDKLHPPDRIRARPYTGRLDRSAWRLHAERCGDGDT
jgi:hypothetical protein